MSALRPTLFLFLVPLAACSAAPATSEPAPSQGEGPARWDAGTHRSIQNIVSASAVTDGAVAYTESDGDVETGRSVIKLQRLDRSARAQGPAIELGSAKRDPYAKLTLATDGVRYVACWSSENALACSSAPAGEGPATPGLSVIGTSPSLAQAFGSWALAYSVGDGTGAQNAVVRIGSDGRAAGSPAIFRAGCRSTPCVPAASEAAVLLAATKDGFLLVGPGEAPQQETARWLDSALAPVADPIDLGVSVWYRGALAVAASGETAAVSLAKPYGLDVFVLDRQRIVSARALAGGGKTGPRVGLVADGASFGIFYSRRDGSHYSPLEQAFAATVDELEDVSLAPLWLHGAPFSARLQPDGSKVVITPAARSQ